MFRNALLDVPIRRNSLTILQKKRSSSVYFDMTERPHGCRAMKIVAMKEVAMNKVAMKKSL